MRSRARSDFIIRRLFLILLPLISYSDEYLISLRYSIKDYFLYNDSIWISRAMQKCSGIESNNALILDNNNSKDLSKVISQNSDEFFSYIQKLDLSTKSKDTTTNFTTSSTTTLELRTTCFKVDFNENLVKITAIK